MLKFKRGSSFLFAGQILLNGQVADMTGWALRSQLRGVVSSPQGDVIGETIAEIPVSWSNASQGLVVLGDDSDTSEWPVGNAVIDIEASAPSGSKVITQTEKVQIVERVTR